MLGTWRNSKQKKTFRQNNALSQCFFPFLLSWLWDPWPLLVSPLFLVPWCPNHGEDTVPIMCTSRGAYENVKTVEIFAQLFEPRRECGSLCNSKQGERLSHIVREGKRQPLAHVAPLLPGLPASRLSPACLVVVAVGSSQCPSCHFPCSFCSPDLMLKKHSKLHSYGMVASQPQHERNLGLSGALTSRICTYQKHLHWECGGCFGHEANLFCISVIYFLCILC